MISVLKHYLDYLENNQTLLLEKTDYSIHAI